MSTFALNKLLDYILSLSLSNKNKDWLVEKIIESKKPMDNDSLREEKLYSMFGAWADDTEMDTIEKSIMEGRMSGNTRHVVSFDEA